jgi:uncharacterized phage protein (TIGR02216 family)
VLHLPPVAFWSMTPRELGLALRGHAGLPVTASATPLDQVTLAALMQRFPDNI